MLCFMRLILIRHGQTSSNVGLLLDTAAPGADLNQTGREQAQTLVERLGAEMIEAIYASTLVRTQQTAAPLAEAHRLEVGVLADLREIGAGDFEMTADATNYITTLMRWGAGDLDARIQGGENATEFFVRYDTAIAHIAAAGHRTAVAVSHGAALRVWASARVPGFTEAIGNGHLANTGLLIAEGSPDDGWTLVTADGFMHYSEEPSVLDPETEEAS
jgi:broad specificity phosphatase PhoE